MTRNHRVMDSVVWAVQVKDRTQEAVGNLADLQIPLTSARKGPVLKAELYVVHHSRHIIDRIAPVKRGDAVPPFSELG